MAATGVEQNCDMLRCRYDFDARFNYNFDANCLNTHARTTITHVPVCVCCCCIACTNCLRQQRIGRRRDKERRSTEKQALHTPRAKLRQHRHTAQRTIARTYHKHTPPHTHTHTCLHKHTHSTYGQHKSQNQNGPPTGRLVIHSASGN